MIQKEARALLIEHDTGGRKHDRRKKKGNVLYNHDHGAVLIRSVILLVRMFKKDGEPL
jgi:hypothetical protein